MSIEQLQEDLKEVVKRAAPGPDALGSGGVDAVWSFLNNDLLPLMQNLVEEVDGIDGALDAVVHSSEDVLHSESAAVFVGLIASGATLVRELETRIGTDQRIMALIREYKKVSKQASELLEEITLPDDDPDTDDGEDGEPVEEETPQ